MNSGIYQIRNLKNNNIYIGSTNDFDIRWKRHRHALRKSDHWNPYLQNAWNKYGEESFVFEILERFFHKSFLIELEQYYIDNLEPEYNVAKIAGGGNLGDEVNRKISKANKERFKDPEQRAKQGRIKSPEEKAKCGRSGEDHPMFGKKRPDVVKRWSDYRNNKLHTTTKD